MAAVWIIAELLASHKEADSILFSSNLQEPVESVELRCKILVSRESMEEVARSVVQALREIADAVWLNQSTTMDWGLKSGGGIGWCMLRSSFHEPINRTKPFWDGVKIISYVLFQGLRRKIPDKYWIKNLNWILSNIVFLSLWHAYYFNNKLDQFCPPQQKVLYNTNN